MAAHDEVAIENDLHQRMSADRLTPIEDGRHVFRRAGEPPARAATPEQLCHLRDAGYVVLHGCVPSAAVDASVE